MLYHIFTVGDTNYKLRINTRNIIDLEKKLGGNPLSIFLADDNIPTVENMVAVLHASLQQYQHDFTMTKTYSLFDEWLDEGNDVTSFIPVILEVYKVSGIVPKDDESDKDEAEKN